MNESPPPPSPPPAEAAPGRPERLRRKDRLVQLIALLRSRPRWRGADLAARLGISLRTLYRDMDTLMRSGVPVEGSRGQGYRMSAPVTLPALNLSMAELEALHLGLAVMSEADDDRLRAAGRSLAAKIDAALPENRIADTAGIGLAVHPFADPASGVRHMAALRHAVRHRRKLRLSYRDDDGSLCESLARPLALDYWGRVWTCRIWCEIRRRELLLRLDRISELAEMPEHF